MKKALFAITLLGLLVLNLSCERCIKCQIMGKNYQDTLFQDTTVIIYPEFCGSPSEVTAFESDVEFAANSRRCITYSIRAIATGNSLLTQTICGSNLDQERAVEVLDSLIQVVYVNQDVEVTVDTIRSNPGKWECK